MIVSIDFVFFSNGCGDADVWFTLIAVSFACGSDEIAVFMLQMYR